jgi:hypothetical protein
MEFIKSFDDFVLTEGRVVFKRKYTEMYPEKAVSSLAPVREKILSFVREKGSVTYNEIMEFVRLMNEESGGATSRKWINKNSRYFKIIEKNGVKTYSLSPVGKRVHEAIMKQKTS